MPKSNENQKSIDSSLSTLKRSISKNGFDMQDITDMNISNEENFRSSLNTLSSSENILTETSNPSTLKETKIDLTKNEVESSNVSQIDNLTCIENFNKRCTISHISANHDKKNEHNVSVLYRRIEGKSSSEIKDSTANMSDSKVFKKSIRPKKSGQNSQHDEHLSLTVDPLQISCVYKSKIRKRKWISKNCMEFLSPILTISTDSLKKLVSDVHPVPLSDIHLDSSSEVEEVSTQLEFIVEKSKSLIDMTYIEIPLLEKENFFPRKILNLTENGKESLIRSPSPSKNKESNILYITNLVRPFTVLQLKGLLARTGKIIDNGFWIDRIKSRCFVQYETEDEAIETRHALHGIRWPNSNPKCLNVDFGRLEEMQKAQQLMNKNEDDIISIFKTDKILPVREWDVGKNKNFDGTKKEKNMKTRSRSCHEEDSYSKKHESEENENRYYKEENSYKSNSPVQKQREKRTRENDPPLRLLDDLFRKTQTTPCVYWLPLTPEQIAEKENVRRKRKERQQKVYQKEKEIFKPYEKAKESLQEIKQEREGGFELDRPSVRRVSGSKDKRWN